MEVWFISVAVKVVQLDSKSHITMDKTGQKTSAVHETPLCNIVQCFSARFAISFMCNIWFKFCNATDYETCAPNKLMLPVIKK